MSQSHSRNSRTVLLLHGATSSSRTWWQVATELEQLGLHVIAADLPGHGQTPTAGSTTPRDMAEQLLDPVDDRSLSVVLGHSLGALVALELFARKPDLAAGLILDEPPGLETVTWSTAPNYLKAEQRTAKNDPEGQAEQLHRALPRWHKKDCTTAVEDLIACDVPAIEAALAEIASGSSHELVRTVNVPTLVLLGPDAPGNYEFGGEYGSSIRGSDRQQFLSSLRNATTSVFGTGHVLHRDSPRQWVTNVNRFIAGLR